MTGVGHPMRDIAGESSPGEREAPPPTAADVRGQLEDILASSDACEIRSGDLYCLNGTVLTYASASHHTVLGALEESLRDYCERFTKAQLRTGMLETEGFIRGWVLSASHATTRDIVCIISYARE